MRDTLRLAAEINLPVIQHAEDTRLTENCSMNESTTSFRLGLRGMGSGGRGTIVIVTTQLAQQFAGARLHVAHLSTADALKAVRRGKRSKAHVQPRQVTPTSLHEVYADVEVDDNTDCKMVAAALGCGSARR